MLYSTRHIVSFVVVTTFCDLSSLWVAGAKNSISDTASSTHGSIRNDGSLLGATEESCSCEDSCKGVASRSVANARNAFEALVCGTKSDVLNATCGDFCETECNVVVPEKHPKQISESQKLDLKCTSSTTGKKSLSLMQLKQASAMRSCPKPQPCNCKCVCPEIVFPIPLPAPAQLGIIPTVVFLQEKGTKFSFLQQKKQKKGRQTPLLIPIFAPPPPPDWRALPCPEEEPCNCYCHCRRPPTND